MYSPGIRWTIGNASERGFEELRLSIWGAWRLFGPAASYVVCVNVISPEQARQRTGRLPPVVRWYDSRMDLPRWLASHLDGRMAEGVGWKFAPLRMFPGRHELALDNDCILWAVPACMKRWLEQEQPSECLMAADVAFGFGQFAPLAGGRPCNSGIRGLPPQFDLAAALQHALRRAEQHYGEPVVLSSELDEQGLQTAALTLAGPLNLVSVEEVSVCSPFHPHSPHLGSCGAHFVGSNARHIPWDYYGRPADKLMTQHWEQVRAVVYQRVRAPEVASSHLANSPETARAS